MLLGLIRRLFGGRSEGNGGGIDEEWKDWNERRMAAKEAGEPFDEPQPVPGRRSRRRRRRSDASAATGATAAGVFIAGSHIDHHGGHDGGGFSGGGGFGGGDAGGGGF